LSGSGTLNSVREFLSFHVLFAVSDKVFFIISDRSASGGGPAVWAELDQASSKYLSSVAL
jgi:hypothetical protein